MIIPSGVRDFLGARNEIIDPDENSIAIATVFDSTCGAAVVNYPDCSEEVRAFRKSLLSRLLVTDLARMIYYQNEARHARFVHRILRIFVWLFLLGLLLFIVAATSLLVVRFQQQIQWYLGI